MADDRILEEDLLAGEAPADSGEVEVRPAGRPSIRVFVTAGGQRGTLVLKFETE